MRAVFDRELQRLRLFGLLAPAAFFLSVVLQQSRKTDGLGELLLIAGFVLAPAILGVATIVPDTASGGTTFFARMPISPGRLLVAKLGAAGSYLLLGIFAGVLAALLDQGLRVDGPRGGYLLALLVLTPLFAFGAGLLASTMASRIMPALLLAPALAAIAYLLGALAPAALFRIEIRPEGIPLLVFPAMTLLFVSAAFLAFTRGRRHLQTPRPALLAGAVLAPALLLWVGSIGVAQAWTASAAVPGLEVVPGATSAGGVTAIQVAGPCWNGMEERVVVLESDGAWTVPERWVRNPMLSPDGKRLLVSSKWERGGFLIDLTTRKIERLPHGRGKEGWGFEHVVWRPDGTPLFVQVRQATITAFDPKQNEIQISTLPRPVTGLAGVTPKQSLVVWAAGGIYELPDVVSWPAPPRGSTRLAEGKRQPTGWRVAADQLADTLRLEVRHTVPIDPIDPANAPPPVTSISEAVLSPDGRHVLTRSFDEQQPLRVYDLAEGTSRVVTLPLLTKTVKRADNRREPASTGFAAQRFGPYVYGFSPDGRLLLIERYNGLACVANLQRGTSYCFDPGGSSPMGLPVVWSPDGRRAVLPSGATVEVDAERVSAARIETSSRLDGTTFQPASLGSLAAWTARGKVPMLTPLRFLADGAVNQPRWKKGGAR